MKSICLIICVVAAIAFLRMTQAKSDEPGKTQTADPMRGKEAGEVRDDNVLKTKLDWCPPGNFTMGGTKSEEKRTNNEDQVEVTLTKGFWLGKYEVTQSEWKQVMKTEPWKGGVWTKEGADFPASHISWNDATDFCRRMTDQERQAGRLPDGWEYMLPTEAQWERACRARTETKFSFGDDESKLGEHAWFDDNAGNAGEQYPHRVGQKKANPWGLFDMHGNIREWCRDIYTEKLPGGRDPEVKLDEKAGGSLRVYRGGGWNSVVSWCRSAYRFRYSPDYRLLYCGFRVALCAVRSVP